MSADAETVKPLLHHMATVRTGRYYTAGAAPSAARKVWIVLHGYGQLAERFMRHFEGIIPADTMIVAPEGLSRFYLELPRADGGHLNRVGAAWITREDRDQEILDSCAWLEGVHSRVMEEITRLTGSKPAVTVLAFSQGVATAMRWIAKSDMTVSRAIFWAGSLANDINADAFKARMAHAELLLVAGTSDQFATPEARQRIGAECQKLGLNFREVAFGGGHEMDKATLAELLNLP